MSTWEERMSARAKARMVVAEAEEATREAVALDEFRAVLPALPGEGDVLSGFLGPVSHRGLRLHEHPEEPSGCMCSCGSFLDFYTVPPMERDVPPSKDCAVCEARGLSV